MTTVASYPLQMEAHLAIARLQSAGIAARTENEFNVTFNWLASPALGWVRVVVPDEDAEAAMALLAAKPEEAGLLRCPHCGSAEVHVRALDPWGAVCVLLKIPLPLRNATVDCRHCGKAHSVPLTPAN